MPGLSDSLEKSHTIWYLCTDPTNMLPTTHPSDPLAVTLSPQLRLNLLKSKFFAIPSTYYLRFYDHIFGLVRSSASATKGVLLPPPSAIIPPIMASAPSAHRISSPSSEPSACGWERPDSALPQKTPEHTLSTLARPWRCILPRSQTGPSWPLAGDDHWGSWSTFNNRSRH